MELEYLENIAAGKLIGLLNGNNEYDINDEFKEFVFYCLDCLKNKKDLELIIDKLIAMKKELLQSCVVCSHPCGRTNDYSLNDISDNEEKENKIKDYYSLLEEYKTIDLFDFIVYRISKLGW